MGLTTHDGETSAAEIRPARTWAEQYRGLEHSPLNRADAARKKVAILGAQHWRTRADVPLADPAWDVWCCNVIPALDHQGRFRADAWFELHPVRAQSPSDLEWIAMCPVPLYVPDAGEAWPPTAPVVAYPLGEIEARFGVRNWACTFAYQIALALHLGYETIGLFGLELSKGNHRERTAEQASVCYWIGRAEGLGVEVVRPVRSWLGRTPLRYGWDYEDEIALLNRYTQRMLHYAQYELRRLNLAGVGAGEVEEGADA